MMGKPSEQLWSCPKKYKSLHMNMQTPHHHHALNLCCSPLFNCGLPQPLNIKMLIADRKTSSITTQCCLLPQSSISLFKVFRFLLVSYAELIYVSYAKDNVLEGVIDEEDTTSGGENIPDHKDNVEYLDQNQASSSEVGCRT